MDKIAQIMSNYTWTYADKDPIALGIIRDRIETAARNRKMLYYSELVNGVVFNLPNINSGNDYEIDTGEWPGLDRRIIGDFLGRLSAESYIEHGFMLSALVVGKNENKPSDIFFEWMKEIDVLPDLEEHTVLAFWAGEVKKALQYYTSGR